MLRYIVGFAVFVTAISCDNSTLGPAEASAKTKKFELLKPLADKVDNVLALVHHPNFGGFQLFNPVRLWEKLHEKAPSYFTGPHGSIYGAAIGKPHDYPFAYRKTQK